MKNSSAFKDVRRVRRDTNGSNSLNSPNRSNNDADNIHHQRRKRLPTPSILSPSTSLRTLMTRKNRHGHPKRQPSAPIVASSSAESDTNPAGITSSAQRQNETDTLLNQEPFIASTSITDKGSDATKMTYYPNNDEGHESMVSSLAAGDNYMELHPANNHQHHHHRHGTTPSSISIPSVRSSFGPYNRRYFRQKDETMDHGDEYSSFEDDHHFEENLPFPFLDVFCYWRKKRRQRWGQILHASSICLILALMLCCLIAIIVHDLAILPDTNNGIRMGATRSSTGGGNDKASSQFLSKENASHDRYSDTSTLSTTSQIGSNSALQRKKLRDRFKIAKTSKNFPNELQYLSDLTTPYNSTIEIPLFWEIPLAGESIAKNVFSQCYNLVQASGRGLQQPQYNEDALERFSLPSTLTNNEKKNTKQMTLFPNATYVNIDTTTMSGLKRAETLNFASRQMADIIFSPFLHATSKYLLTKENPGRMVAMFRHPIDRAVGWYNYIGQATWDHLNYNPDVKSMTLTEYAVSDYIHDNPMTRMLTSIQLDNDGGDNTNNNNKDNNKESPEHPTRELTRKDLDLAKKILQQKCLVGLYRDRLGSLARFDRYFGFSWDTSPNHALKDKIQNLDERVRKVKSCRASIVKKGDRTLRHSVTVQTGSEEWELLKEKNLLDLELYEYIEVLYDVQGKKIFGVVD